LIASTADADVLVLAGDIANGTDGLKLFADWRRKKGRKVGRTLPILFIVGNHEYYGHALAPMQEQMRQATTCHDIHFLENNCVVIGDVRFLGTTLWTDYRLFPTITQLQAMETARQKLNDHQPVDSHWERTIFNSGCTGDALQFPRMAANRVGETVYRQNCGDQPSRCASNVCSLCIPVSNKISWQRHLSAKISAVWPLRRNLLDHEKSGPSTTNSSSNTIDAEISSITDSRFKLKPSKSVPHSSPSSVSTIW